MPRWHVALTAAAVLSTAATAATTEMVSLTTGGLQGSGDAVGRTCISSDGGVVAFVSAAPDLVPGDGNGVDDIFVHDRATGVTERASVSTGGAEAAAASRDPAISGDGRWVAFTSDAVNLVPNDANGAYDVFLHDRTTGATTRVSVSSAAGEADAPSMLSGISANGRLIVFTSLATNLVPGDANGQRDVFVHDTAAGTTTRVSVASDGAEGNGDSWRPSISADGRFVAFDSFASNLVANDTNNSYDIFFHDRQTGVTQRVSVDTAGAQSNGDSYYPAISRGGAYVAFYSSANNLVAGDGNGVWDVFVRNVAAGTTALASIATGGAGGDGQSRFPAISDDGRFVAFESDATNLVPGDGNAATDVFVRDVVAGTTARVSLSTTDTQGNGASTRPWAAGMGRYICFLSAATDLVPADANGFADVFARDRADLVGQGVVGPGGGVVAVAAPASPLNGLRVNVPPGALAANANIGVAEVVGGPPPPANVIGPPFALSPERLAFGVPVTVDVPHDPALAYAYPLRVYWWDAAGWQWRADGITNVTENATVNPNVVSFDSTHFTVFQVASTPVAAAPPAEDDDDEGGGSECFVATAAYGSARADEVDALRGFRDDCLEESAAGRTFIKLYYRYGPLAADAIRGKEASRASVRLVLHPLAELAGAAADDR